MKKYVFPLILFISVLLGAFLGIIDPSLAFKIKPLGDIFLNAMFTLVVPLVFFTIVSSVLNMKSMTRLSKILKKTFLVFVITSLISTLFMLGFLLITNPFESMNITLEVGKKETVNVLEKIVSAITVTDFKELFTKNNMLPLIIFSLIFGISLRMINKEEKINSIFNVITKANLKMIEIVMYYAPIGIFAYFASLIAEFGPEFTKNYARVIIIYFVVTILYFIIFYTLYAFISGGKKGVKDFYKKIFPSFLTSLATQSSLASLPTNVKTAKELKIDEEVSSISLPIGATMHMEGSSIGSILKIFFLFSLFNMPFNSIDVILVAILISILSGVVMSGIPGGGLIGELLIVSMYGLPSEAFIVISTIGWIIDAPATMLNVVGDISSALLIDKYVNKKV